MLVLSNIRRLYDGTGSEKSCVQEFVDLSIRSGRIDSVGPHNPDLVSQGERTVVDCSDLTVTPGLIDCHGHITLLGLSGPEIDAMGQLDSLLLVEKILHATLVDGCVTTMRDVGGATDRMKRMVGEGRVIGPRLKIAICMLSSTGGHADFRGPDRCHGELSRLWPEGPGRPSSVVDGPWECRKRVREVVACGADLIKVCASPGVASPSDKLEHRDFTAEELAAICEEATARGLRVAAHAHSMSGIEMAIAAGVHDIQHISYMQPRHVEAAFEKGCTVTPTSWVMKELESAEGLSPFVMEKVKQVGEVHAMAVQHAASGDLPILMGTDPVLPGMHGRNYMELVHLIGDGLSPLRAWYGATGLAAKEIGQEDAGTLLPGQRADLLVAREDILNRPEALDRGALVEVIQDGVGHRGGLMGVPQRTYAGLAKEAMGRGALT